MHLRKKPKRAGALTVTSTFARLIAIERDIAHLPVSYSYEFEYDIDHDTALRENVKSIHIAIKSPSKIVESMWADQTGERVSVDSVLDSILLTPQRARTSHLADVKSSHKAVTLIKPQRKQVKQVVPQQLGDIRRANFVDHVMLGTTTSVKKYGAQPGPAEIQQVSLDLLFKHRIDPAEAFIGASATSSARAFGGVGSGKPVRQNAATAKALTVMNTLFNVEQYKMSDLDDDVVVPVVTQTSTNVQRQVVAFTVSESDVAGLSTFDVEFITLDGSGDVVDRQTRVVKHEHILATFLMPRISPQVTISTSIPGRNIIDLMQLDAKASGIKMYKRVVANTTDVEDQQMMAYTHIGDVAITTDDGAIKITDPTCAVGTSMYRFVSYGYDGQMSTSFTNVLVSGANIKIPRRRANITCALDINSDDGGAIISITNISSGPVAVALQRKNMTSHENSYAVIGSVILTKNAEDAKFEDRTVKRGNIYDYNVVMFFADGSSIVSAVHQLYEHPATSNRGVQIVTSDPQIKHITQLSKTQTVKGIHSVAFDVQFSIESNIVALDDDMLRDVLEQRGLSVGYAAELIASRDKLTNLIAHHVLRCNLSTGLIEDLGIVTSSIFSDVAASRVNAANQIVTGTKYKYVITTLLRSPETMFDEFEKTVTVQNDKFATQTSGSLASVGYSYRPAKFKHPITLQTGTLTSVTSRRDRHGRDEFMYGAIGNAKTLEVSIPRDSVTLSDVTVEHLDTTTNVINWTLLGNPMSVDYFIVVSTQMGVDTVIGKVHALQNTTAFKFVHDLDSAEVGTTVYTVHAVMTNFAIGPNATSAQVII